MLAEALAEGFGALRGGQQVTAVPVAEDEDEVGIAFQVLVTQLGQYFLCLLAEAHGLGEVGLQQVVVGDHREAEGTDVVVMAGSQRAFLFRAEPEVAVVLEQQQQLLKEARHGVGTAAGFGTLPAVAQRIEVVARLVEAPREHQRAHQRKNQFAVAHHLLFGQRFHPADDGSEVALAQPERTALAQYRLEEQSRALLRMAQGEVDALPLQQGVGGGLVQRADAVLVLALQALHQEVLQQRVVAVPAGGIRIFLQEQAAGLYGFQLPGRVLAFQHRVAEAGVEVFENRAGQHEVVQPGGQVTQHFVCKIVDKVGLAATEALQALAVTLCQQHHLDAGHPALGQRQQLCHFALGQRQLHVRRQLPDMAGLKAQVMAVDLQQGMVELEPCQREVGMLPRGEDDMAARRQAAQQLSEHGLHQRGAGVLEVVDDQRQAGAVGERLFQGLGHAEGRQGDLGTQVVVEGGVEAGLGLAQRLPEAAEEAHRLGIARVQREQGAAQRGAGAPPVAQQGGLATAGRGLQQGQRHFLAVVQQLQQVVAQQAGACAHGARRSCHGSLRMFLFCRRRGHASTGTARAGMTAGHQPLPK